MTTIKVTNCTYKDRKNQNTTFFFSEIEFGFGKGDVITEQWIIDNLNKIKKDILPQKDTKVKINRVKNK